MPKKTGKEYEWEVAVASASPLAQLIQDYDWADEILHARIGRDWLTLEFGGQQQVLAAGDEAWSRAISGWEDLRDQGLTDHHNWWPELYQAACARWGMQPDPHVLAFNVTYQAQRPDRKELAATA